MTEVALLVTPAPSTTADETTQKPECLRDLYERRWMRSHQENSAWYYARDRLPALPYMIVDKAKRDAAVCVLLGPDAAKLTYADFCQALLYTFPELWALIDHQDTLEGLMEVAQPVDNPTVPHEYLRVSNDGRAIAFDKSIAGAWMWWLVRHDRYAEFVVSQPPAVRLGLRPWQLLRTFTEDVEDQLVDELTLHTQNPIKDVVVARRQAILGTLFYIILNDFGKLQFLRDTLKKLGLNAEEVEAMQHSQVLRNVFVRAGVLLPSLEIVSADLIVLMLNGWATRIPFTELGQAESVPISLAIMTLESTAYGQTMGNQDCSFIVMRYYLLHYIYDLAGVMGHEKGNTGCAVMTFPVFDGIWDVVTVVLENVVTKAPLENQEACLRYAIEAYDKLLSLRAAKAGILYPASYDDGPAAHTLVRLTMMARRVLPYCAHRLLARAFDTLEPGMRAVLVNEMSRHTLIDVVYERASDVILNGQQMPNPDGGELMDIPAANEELRVHRYQLSLRLLILVMHSVQTQRTAFPAIFAKPGEIRCCLRDVANYVLDNIVPITSLDYQLPADVHQHFRLINYAGTQKLRFMRITPVPDVQRIPFPAPEHEEEEEDDDDEVAAAATDGMRTEEEVA